MKRLFLILAFCGLCFSSIYAQPSNNEIPHSTRIGRKVKKASRVNIILPQVNGLNCYKADFHIHTSYSDGLVTPAARVGEAWRDGLDIIAITDHYEALAGVKRFFNATAPYYEGTSIKYQTARQANGIKADFNAMYQEAVKQLEKKKYPMLVIKGCEMGRNAKTHGHFNCLFVNDINTLYDKDIKVAFRRVHEQGGIVIHNHPAWMRDTSDKTEFHEEAYGEGLIDGVEIVNNQTFYPHMVRRCVDEKLTMFANTDIHRISYAFTSAPSHIYRTMTLVFAKELTEEAVKEALLKRQTLGYLNGYVIGEIKLLSDFLNESVDCRVVEENKEAGTRKYMLVNNTSIPYQLRASNKKVVKLAPFKPAYITISGKDALDFVVKNMYYVDYQNPTIKIKIDKK